MRDIDKRFQGVNALAKASLEVEPGEIMALVGQNGAGKSTLIKVLTGAYARDSGSITLDGRPIAFASPQEAQRGGISTIYQEINLVPFRSVTENIFLGREHRRYGLLDWGRMNGEAAEVLRRFDVAIDVRRPLMDFSTAIQQMVAIARAVSFEARLVIMDEPTSSLDEREVEVLFDVMRRLRAEGVAVVFISHRLDELYRVCDRVTVMRDGRTIATRRIGEVDKLQLVAAMLGRDVEAVRGRETGFSAASGKAGDDVLSVEGLEIGRRVRDVRLEVRSGQIVGLGQIVDHVERIVGFVGRVSGKRVIGRSGHGRGRPGQLGKAGAPADTAGQHHRQETDGEEPEEHPRAECRLIHADMTEVTELAAAGQRQQRQDDRSDQRRHRQLGEGKSERERLSGTLLTDGDTGHRADDQQCHPDRAQRRRRHRRQDGQRGDVAAEHREGAEGREPDVGAGTHRHRRRTEHHVGQVQQRQDRQAQLPEKRVGDAEQILHGATVHHQ